MSPRPHSLAIVAAVLLTGCAAWPHGKKKKSASGPAIRQEFAGIVTLVNEDNHFVLIDGGYSTAPADGLKLKSFTDDAESGTLTVSPQHRRPFVIADIASGTPKKGDRVRESATPPIPATVPATPH